MAHSGVYTRRFQTQIKRLDVLSLAETEARSNYGNSSVGSIINQPRHSDERVSYSSLFQDAGQTTIDLMHDTWIQSRGHYFRILSLIVTRPRLNGCIPLSRRTYQLFLNYRSGKHVDCIVPYAQSACHLYNVKRKESLFCLDT